jgi:hypothetical protein
MEGLSPIRRESDKKSKRRVISFTLFFKMHLRDGRVCSAFVLFSVGFIEDPSTRWAIANRELANRTRQSHAAMHAPETFRT